MKFDAVVLTRCRPPWQVLDRAGDHLAQQVLTCGPPVGEGHRWTFGKRMDASALQAEPARRQVQDAGLEADAAVEEELLQ